ncbi:unnamed protein product [Linum trigynum]|uniref:Retrotransposon gag domain-containing protein n=1 Tax=Linum trigynum TaxID=586398 RepID=A0AAV2E9T2_9ROSI
MTRSNPIPLTPLDEDINRTLRLLTREREQAESRRRSEEKGQQVGPGIERIEGEVEVEIAGNQHRGSRGRSKDYGILHGSTGGGYPISHLTSTRGPNNFEIKPSLVTMIQQNAYFHGLGHESPREHVERFLELAGSLKINGLPEEALRFKIFPYSLAVKALRWLNNHLALSITSWDDLLINFMTRYCPPSKKTEWRKKITHFEQEDDETLRDAWERFSDYFLQCPHHGFEEKSRIETFYGGLIQDDKILIDSLFQGKLMNMTPPQVTDLLEDMALKRYDWGLTRIGKISTEIGVQSVGASAPLEAKLDKLIEVILEDKKQEKRVVMSCDWCSSTNHEIADCLVMKETSNPEEQVSFIANARGKNPYRNTYNPWWRNHPNCAWSSPTNPRPPGFQGPTGNYQPRPTFIQQRPQFPNSNFLKLYQAQGGQGFQQEQQQVNKFSKLEDLVTSFVSTRSQKFEKIEQFMDVVTSKFTSVAAGLRSHQASLQNLEVQISNLVGILTKIPKGALPSQTITNPKDHAVVNAIHLRSGKVTPEVVAKELNEKEDTLPEGEEEETSGGKEKSGEEGIADATTCGRVHATPTFSHKDEQGKIGSGMWRFHADAPKAPPQHSLPLSNDPHAKVLEIPQGISLQEAEV